MKKSAKITVFACLAVFFIAVVGYGVKQTARAEQAERLLSNTYYHAFTELTTAAGELDSALQKVTYTTPGPLQDSLYQQIYAKALAAQYALGELPYSNIDLEETAAFFAKTGDYAMSLARSGGGRKIYPATGTDRDFGIYRGADPLLRLTGNLSGISATGT